MAATRLNRFSLTVFKTVMAPRSTVRTRDPVSVAMLKCGPTKSLLICRIHAKKCCRRKLPIRLFPCLKGSSSAVRAGKFTRWVSRWRVKLVRPTTIAMLGLLAFRPTWLSGYMSAMTTTAHWVGMKQAGALPLLSSGLS